MWSLEDVLRRLLMNSTSYEQRVVNNTELNGYIIDTCYANDTEYCINFREVGCTIRGTLEQKKKYYITSLNKSDKEKFVHPTIKPLNIIKNLIINSSNKDDVVLDCFLGSGTTAVAAKELGRHYIGFEINKDYFKIAQDRLNGIDANGQYSLF